MFLKIRSLIRNLPGGYLNYVIAPEHKLRQISIRKSFLKSLPKVIIIIISKRVVHYIMDVMPTAPTLYPTVENAENFRLNKATLVVSYLDAQARHYKNVRKKYAKARSVMHKVAITTGSLSVALTGTGLATSLMGPGMMVGVPIASAGAVCGVVSATCTAIMKKLSKKISKHDQQIMLAKSKSNTITDRISRALRDRVIDDKEFSIIIAEEDKYEKMKAQIGKKAVVVTEEERKNIYQSVRDELQRKLAQ